MEVRQLEKIVRARTILSYKVGGFFCTHANNVEVFQPAISNRFCSKKQRETPYPYVLI